MKKYFEPSGLFFFAQKIILDVQKLFLLNFRRAKIIIRKNLKFYRKWRQLWVQDDQKI